MVLTIYRKLILSFTLLVIIVSGIGITGINSIYKINDDLIYMNVRANKLEDILMLKYAATATLEVLADLVISNDISVFGKVDKFLELFEEEITHFVGEVAGVAEKQIGEKLEKYHDTLDQVVVQMKRLASEGEWEEVKELREEQIEPIVKKLDDIINSAVEEVKDDSTQAKKRAIKTSDGAVFLMFALTLIAGVSGILIAFFLTKNISASINNLVFNIRDISKGDLTKRVKIISEDELGTVAKTFNEFVEKIQNIIINILNSSQNLQFASEEIATSIEEAAASCDELAKGTEIQSAAVEQSNCSMVDMDNAIKGVTKNSLLAGELSSNTNDVAVKGGASVIETVKAMKNIVESSNKMEVIVGVITDIANQTNLLALNAAIEAAKAGEQGKGFAVVAEEVRKLAERASNSTKEIQGLITESTDRIANGTTVANEAGNALKEIINGINSTNKLVAEISSAAELQSTSVGLVSKSIQELAGISEQSLGSTEELSSTTRQLALGADELSNMAGALNGLVNKFKVVKINPNVKSNSGKRVKLIKHRVLSKQDTGLVVKT